MAREGNCRRQQHTARASFFSHGRPPTRLRTTGQVLESAQGEQASARTVSFISSATGHIESMVERHGRTFSFTSLHAAGDALNGSAHTSPHHHHIIHYSSATSHNPHHTRQRTPPHLVPRRAFRCRLHTDVDRGSEDRSALGSALGPPGASLRGVSFKKPSLVWYCQRNAKECFSRATKPFTRGFRQHLLHSRVFRLEPARLQPFFLVFGIR